MTSELPPDALGVAAYTSGMGPLALGGLGISLLARDHGGAPPPRLRRPLHRWGLARLDGG